MDNAVVHKSAAKGWDTTGDWRESAGIKGPFFPPPPYSPDIHQVIEHAIANMSRHFKHELALRAMRRQERMMSMTEFFQLAVDCFRLGNSDAAIRANVDGIEETFKAIVALNGDLPEKKLR